MRKLDDAATANAGIGSPSSAWSCLYVGFGITAILVLRGMSRRYRQTRRRRDDAVVPYGPDQRRDQTRGAGPMSTAAAVILFAAITVYAIFGGATSGPASGPDRRRSERGERPRDGSTTPSPRSGSRPRWLIFSFVVLWTYFPTAYESIGLTLFVPLTLAAAGSSSAEPASLLQSRVPHPVQRNFGAAFELSSVLVPYCLGTVAGSIASGRVPPAARPATPGTAGSTRPRSWRARSPSCVAAYLAAVYLVWDARRLSDHTMVAYSEAEPPPRPWSPASRARRYLRPPQRPPLPLRRATSRALPLVIVSAIGGAGSLWLLRNDATRAPDSPQ